MSLQSVTSADSYAAIEAQVSHAGAQAAVAKQGIVNLSAQKELLQRTGEVGDALQIPSAGNNQHAQVYGDLAAEAFGLGGVKNLLDIATQGFDPGKFGKHKTFEDLRGQNKTASIKTKPMSKKGDLLCRSKTVSDFNKNSGTGEMAGKQQMAGLNNQIQQMQALLKGHELSQGMGHQAKLIKGHEGFAARQGLNAPAIGSNATVMQLAKDKMQPKGPTHLNADGSTKQPASTDDTTAWA